MTIANAIIQDWENLTISEGRHAGKAMTVLDWQSGLAHVIPDYSTIGITMSRGNGKTLIAAALACSALLPEGALFQPRGEIDLIASSLGQARISYRHIYYFLRERIESERKDWRCIDNSHQAQIEHKPSGTILKALGSDPRRAHGLAPLLCIADEPAQWLSGGRPMYNALRTALGKQMNSKLIAIGTRPADEHHWFGELLSSKSKSTHAIYYAAENGDPDFDEATIRKANPSYDHMPDLRKIIWAEAEGAKAGGDDLACFRAFRLNMGTEEVTGKELLVSLDNWRSIVTDEPPAREGPVFVGVDLGGGTSMSAVAFFWALTGRLEAYGAFPAEPSLEERGKQDKVERRYIRMKERGDIFVYPGRATNNTKFLEEMFGFIKGHQIGDGESLGIAADRYKQNDLKQVLGELGRDPETSVEWRGVGRGPDGADDVKAFQREVLTGFMGVPPNLALESAITEAVIHRDSNGNAALNKARHRGRIDVMQAAILAVGIGRRWRVPTDSSQVGGLWEDMVREGHALVGGI